MKDSHKDKARILKITTRTLQRWKTSKPELYAIIEAGFKMRELVADEEQSLSEIKKMIKEALPQS